MLIMIHNNRACVADGKFHVDRKFHLGMQVYAKKIGVPILSVHPESKSGEQTMDLVQIPCDQLEYRVMVLKVDQFSRPLASELERLGDQIAKSRLLYGYGLGSIKLAKRLGVPYILLLEYDLKTQLVVTTTQVTNILRKITRAARCTLNYVTSDILNMRTALGLHCNGYPIFDESKPFNSNRLIYLDSRMSADLIISENRLMARLSSRQNRPLRLLFSGRYEPMKGADDVVRVALECLKRGLDIELHCYGQGSLRNQMEALAEGHPRIRIHGAIPYPELVECSYTFDIFVCCHIQNDPSCTYLESFGAGLPIVGYGNRMWRRLNEVSGVGFWSPVGKPQAVADHIHMLASNAKTMAEMSIKARQFAIEHTFEREFARRIDDLNVALEAL